MAPRRARAVLGAVLAGVVVLAGLTASGAAADSARWTSGACARGTGVTVVVEWETSRTTRCVPGGARLARAAFVGAGHTLDDVQRTPGFVCRIDSRPGPDVEPCVVTPPATAYWSLWWSKGTNGTWTYSQLGVDSLTVPKGGWVAFDFHRGESRAAAPTARLPLADKKLAVGLRYATVKRKAHQRVTVKGLAKGERTTIAYRGRTIARPTASSSGTISHRFRVGATRGKVTVKVTGAHRGRVGSKAFRVR